MNVELQVAASALTTIEVAASGRRRDLSVPNGSTRLSLQQVERHPVLLGEKDIFKALQLLPGVGNPREGFGGLYVRGGTPDQNLVLLDGAPVYNAEHLFGFLSVFNTDALKSVDLYRGGFPARFGGRVGSVLDVCMREGSRINDRGLKADLDWYFSRRHSARFGLAAYRHAFDLGTVARTTAEEADQVSGRQRGDFPPSGRAQQPDRTGPPGYSRQYYRW